MKRFLLCIPILILAGCSDQTGHAFRTFLENGVSVAETTGGPRYTEPLFTFEEMLRLEQDESRPETLYVNPTGFMMGPEGNYFVLDRGTSTILKYDANGTYTGSFGGRGEGPGEFMMPDLEAIEGDTLILYDRSQMRLTRFRTDGTLLDIIPTQAYNWMPYILPISGNRFVVNTGKTEFRGDFMYRASLLFIVNAADKDTTCSLSTSLVQNSFVTRSGSAWSASSLPYVAWPSVQYIRGQGILVSDGDRPELAWCDLEGSIRSIIRLGMDERLMTVA